MIPLEARGFHKAFTMLELVFVIVILGIVSSIGAEIIAKAYGSYIVQKAAHNSSLKTDIAASQLANRLSNALPFSVIARQDATTFAPIYDANGSFQILEWIGVDTDSFNYSGNPGWSGFVDVNHANTSLNSLVTQGSNLNNANTVINNLSTLNTKGVGDGAVFFPLMYNEHDIGFAETTRSVAGVSTVDNVALNLAAVPAVLTLDNVATRVIKEHYKFAWTAYALVPAQLNAAQLASRGFDTNETIFDLTLFYNYQPWNGETYTANGNSAVFLRNVSVFNFTGDGTTIRFKLCKKESIGETFPISMCKEKVVIR